MSTITVQYQLSHAARRRIAVQTGDEPDVDQVLEIDLASLAPEQRALLLNARDPFGRVVKLCKLVPKSYATDDASYYEASLSMDDFQSAESVLSYLASLAAQKATAETRQAELRTAANAEAISQARAYLEGAPTYAPTVRGWKGAPGYDEIVTLAQQVEAEKERRAVLAREQREHEKAEADARREAQHEARLEWAREHGSDQLRRGLEAGYTSTRLYWAERAAIEHPGYTLDFDKHSEWKERAAPSVAALDERDAVLAAHPGAKVNIVWLTSPAHAERHDSGYGNDDFEPCEAVVVDDDEYDHWLVKVI